MEYVDKFKNRCEILVIMAQPNTYALYAYEEDNGNTFYDIMKVYAFEVEQILQDMKNTYDTWASMTPIVFTDGAIEKEISINASLKTIGSLEECEIMKKQLIDETNSKKGGAGHV